MSAATVSPPPKPGWYVRLEGDEFDLEDWRAILHEPFDPVALQLPSGETVLRSRELEGLDDPSEVRDRGSVLVARLNGALGVSNATQSARFGGLVRIDNDGRQHSHVFAELVGMGMRAKMRGVAVVLGPDGKPKPPPPPEPSGPQQWNELATTNDDIADLLDHFGRADNWYDIYKTIEIAAHLVGSKHRLWMIAGAQRGALRNLDRTANFYRHARGAPRPASPVSLNDGRPLLSWLVRTVLDREVARQKESAGD